MGGETYVMMFTNSKIATNKITLQLAMETGDERQTQRTAHHAFSQLSFVFFFSVLALDQEMHRFSCTWKNKKINALGFTGRIFHRCQLFCHRGHFFPGHKSWTLDFMGRFLELSSSSYFSLCIDHKSYVTLRMYRLTSISICLSKRE